MKSTSTGRSMPDKNHAARAHRTLRLIVILAWLMAFILILFLAVLGAASWYFSSQLLDVRPDRPSYELKVLALGRTTIELPRTGSTQRPGVYGVDWPGGRVTLGSIVSMTSRTVVRHYSGSSRGLRPGDSVDFDVAVYGTPAGIPAKYRTVYVPDAVGPMPAWFIPGRRRTWAILVHGYKSSRTDPLRAVPALTALGLPILDLSYRNDAGAPSSPDHLYHLGASEWQDVEAGVRFALAHGARSVVLYGYSMGGGIVEYFLYRSRYAGRVRAVVLDAPALDWGATIDLAASQRGLPSFLAAVTERVIAWRLGMWDLGPIDAVSRSALLRTPTLLFHGRDDQLVPIGPSISLARNRPDLVTFVPVPGAGHTESWNVGPARYESRVDAFLSRVLKTPPSASATR
jgi:pimeloyl-ACP methyl ester carboxylesterase